MGAVRARKPGERRDGPVVEQRGTPWRLCDGRSRRNERRRPRVDAGRPTVPNGASLRERPADLSMGMELPVGGTIRPGRSPLRTREPVRE